MRGEFLAILQAMMSLLDVGPLYNLIYCSFFLVESFHLRTYYIYTSPLSWDAFLIECEIVSHRKPQSSTVTALDYSLIAVTLVSPVRIRFAVSV
jgi:hypothetical protein